LNKEKRKPISYNTIRRNKTLDGFLVHEEDEEEVKAA